MKFTNVTVIHRDTCGEGFLPLNSEFELNHIDAVFLDVPRPWEAIVHAKKVLAKSGRICCFSPCNYLYQLRIVFKIKPN
jgi:tRNA (adenine57-N1/adenine58-N1)-methyltransferase